LTLINDDKNIALLNNSFSEKDDQNGASETGAIIVTGAAGFIGSCMVEYLNDQGFENLILVDDFGAEEKRQIW